MSKLTFSNTGVTTGQPVLASQVSQSFNAFTGTGDYAITISGSLTQNGSPSDIKYKENIKTISNGIDKIEKLNPVEFDWNDKSDAHKIGKKEDAGFIAQEVQKVLPNLVNENVDGDLALNYEGIIPYLVQSIQQLKKEIEI